MNPTVGRIGRYGKRLARRLGLLPEYPLDDGRIVGELVWNRLYHRNDHIAGNTFRRFQFFELAFKDGE
jgi:hypothetical protein